MPSLGMLDTQRGVFETDASIKAAGKWRGCQSQVPSRYGSEACDMVGGTMKFTVHRHLVVAA